MASPRFTLIGLITVLLCLLTLSFHYSAAPKPVETAKSDWPMFGGSPGRNMSNLVDKDIPGKLDLAKNLKWKAQLGSWTYGCPVIAGGRVFVGANNEKPRNPRDRDTDADRRPIDKGILMCFEEANGKFLWQAVHDKLPAGQVVDWPNIGVCSTPTVVGDRIYYVSNRCAVVCADVNGFANGNDGIQTEKYKDATDADIVWEYDMMRELHVFPHNKAACSPLVLDGIVFVVTANGVDEGHINLPAPDAPSFIALDQKTGKLLWQSKLPGKNIMHGQWSSPAFGEIGGVKQVVFPGGDGWLYSFEPATGKLLWKFDANPKDAKYDLGGTGTRSDFIGTPVIHDGRIYIGTGQDPEHFEGVGHFYCIDPTKAAKGTMDISPELLKNGKGVPNPDSAVVWHYGGTETRKHANRDFIFGRTMGTTCVVNDVVYITEIAGYLHCLDRRTGKRYWMCDLKSGIWGSAFYADAKVFVGTEDGDLHVFRHDPKPKVLDETAAASEAADEKQAKKRSIEMRKELTKDYLIAKVELEEVMRTTPVVAGGVLYVITERSLYAFGK